MNLNFDSMSASERYFAMTQVLVPRPIAWVLSANTNTVLNLAPFSFFTGISSQPPLLMISVGHKKEGREAGLQKDTRRNIQEHGDFVVHIPSTEHIDWVNASAATLDHGCSEIDALSLETVPFDDFPLPRLAACAVAFGCKRYRIDEIGENKQAVIYGEISHLYLSDDIAHVNDQNRLKVDSLALNPLSRLGGSEYSGLGEKLQANRPK